MSLWTDRTLPVLLAVFEIVEDGEVRGSPHPEVTESTGLAEAVVLRQLQLLHRDGYLSGVGTNRSGQFMRTHLTERGLREVEAWPNLTAEKAVEAMIAALARAVDTADDDQKSALTSAISVLRDTSVGIGSGVGVVLLQSLGVVPP